MHLWGAVAPVWHEWFSRGLRPGTHYLEVPAAPLAAICPALLKEMLAMDNSSFANNTSDASRGSVLTTASAISTAQTEFVQQRLRMQVCLEMVNLNSPSACHQHAQVLAAPTPCKALGPLQDVREYLLDVLGAYSQLQRFSPTPSATAQHVTAEVLLQHFLFDEDRATILAAYPWLHCQLARGL